MPLLTIAALAKERTREEATAATPVASSVWYKHAALNEYWEEWEYRGIHDWVTPGYKEIIAGGQIINNPMELVVQSVSQQAGSIIINNAYAPKRTPYGEPPLLNDTPMWLNMMHGWLPRALDSDYQNLPGPLLSPLDVEHEIEIRKQLALSFVDKPLYDFGEDFFEFRETLRFIRHPLQSLSSLINAFSKDVSRYLFGKNRLKTAVHRMEAVAGVFATYSFALAPLLRSIDDGMKALADEKKLPFRRTSRSKGHLETTLSDQSFSTKFYPSWTTSMTITNSQSVDIHTGVIYDAPPRTGVLDLVRAKTGLRNKDIPKILWEVIPLSFMVDRVVTVKNSVTGFLNLLDPMVKIQAGFTVTKRTTRSVTTLDSLISNDPLSTVTTFAPMPQVRQYFTYEREVWNPSGFDALPCFNPKQLVKDLQSTAELGALIVLKLAPIIKAMH